MLTLEKQLSSFVDEDSVYKHLYNTWDDAKENMEKILRNIVLSFPHYSMHDASHSEMIIRHIESVLGEKRIALLKPTEIWLILMSAYTHDIGMLISDKEVHNIWESDSFKEYLENLIDTNKESDLFRYANCILNSQDDHRMPSDWPVDIKIAVVYLTADYVRSKHSNRSEQFICEPDMEGSPVNFDFSFSNFIKERIQILLGRIDGLHGASFEDIFSLEKRCQGLGLPDDIVYPRRVAALLRLGDLLDLDNKRFDENAYPLLGRVPETTGAHRRKHASLRHFLIADNKIEVGYDCPDEDTYMAASSWMSYLKTETENLALHWNEIVSDNFGSAPVLSSLKINLNGKPIEGNTLDGFKFTRENIFELLTGANIYRNKFACFRELIQNADDASKIRLWEDIQARTVQIGEDEDYDLHNLMPFNISDDIRKKYPIDISIQYDKQKNGFNVIIKDKGIGINKQRLKQMENVSESWHDKGESKHTYANMPKWLTPTGAFGLGLQSVFLLTDTLHCITSPRHESPKDITFRSKKKGGRISQRELSSEEIHWEGTKFEFFISRDQFTNYSWQLGGILDQKMEKIDPFQYDDLDVNIIYELYYMLECIGRDTSNNFFPINISLSLGADNDKNIKYKFYQQRNYDNADNKSFHMLGDYLYVKFNKNAKIILMYNKNNAISYSLSLDKSLSNRRGDIFFKGISVDSPRFFDTIPAPYGHYIYGNVYLDGFNTKEYLTLNREKIREEKLQEVKKIILKDIYLLIEYIITQYINENPDINISYTEENLFSLGCLTGLLLDFNFSSQADKSIKDTVHNFRMKIKDELLSDETCYRIDEGKAKKDKIQLSDLFTILWNRQPFFLLKVEGKSPMSYHQYSYGRDCEKQELDALNKLITDNGFADKIKKEDTILPTRILNGMISLFSLSIDDIAGNIERGPTLYRCKLNNDNIILPTVTKDIKNCINSHVKRTPRVLTNAIEDYAKLAVQYGKYFSYHHIFEWCNILRAYMISPFSQEDINNFSDIKSKGAAMFLENLRHRKDFRNLVRYIHKYTIYPKITDEEICDAYKHWIEDIFELEDE